MESNTPIITAWHNNAFLRIALVGFLLIAGTKIARGMDNSPIIKDPDIVLSEDAHSGIRSLIQQIPDTLSPLQRKECYYMMLFEIKQNIIKLVAQHPSFKTSDRFDDHLLH